MLKDQEKLKQDFHCSISDTEITIHFCKEIGKYYGKTLKLPKRNVGYEWVLSKIEKENVFISFAAFFYNIMKKNNLSGSCYATTYGIGISSLFFATNPEMKERIEVLLLGLGIELVRTEYSEASYAFRYRIAQNQKNIQTIKNLIKK